MKQKKAKRDNLDDALAASFAAPPKKKATATKKEPVAAPDPEPVAAPVVETPEPEAKVEEKPAKPKSVGTVKKSTISLYPHELDVVDRILDQLRDEGRVRGGLTDAVRVALRLCPTDPKEVYKAWETSKQDDGRVVRHKK